MELLAEGGDVEEERLLGGLAGGEGLPPHALLVIGREKVRQVVSAGVGAEGSDQAIFLQPAPEQLCLGTRQGQGLTQDDERTPRGGKNVSTLETVNS